MIPEERLLELFDTLPPIKVGGKCYVVNSEIGTPKDLNRYLNLKRKEVENIGGNIYPILWIQTPILPNGNEFYKEFPLSIVLATLTNSEMSNKERLKTTFADTLNPLFDNVLKALRMSGFTQILTETGDFNTEFRRSNHYNYGTPEGTQHITTDIWDAILLECNVSMNTNCLTNINY